MTWWDPTSWNWGGDSSGYGAFAPSDTGGVESGTAGTSSPAFDPSNTGGVNASAPSFGDWLMSKEGAAALQKTGDALKGPDANAAPKGSTLTPAQMPGGSQVVRGNTQTLSQLMQMLSNRRYSPIGYSGGSSGGSTRGLLGY